MSQKIGQTAQFFRADGSHLNISVQPQLHSHETTYLYENLLMGPTWMHANHGGQDGWGGLFMDYGCPKN